MRAQQWLTFPPPCSCMTVVLTKTPSSVTPHTSSTVRTSRATLHGNHSILLKTIGFPVITDDGPSVDAPFDYVALSYIYSSLHISQAVPF